MGNLPYARERDFVDASGPAIDDVTLNDMQDGIIDLKRGESGEDLVFEDDFLGDVVDTSRWIDTSTGAGANPTVVEDDANDGAGALQMSTNDADLSTLNTRIIPVKTRDYRWIVRARVSSMGGASSYFLARPEFSNGQRAGWAALASSSNWQYFHDFALPGTDVAHDSGIPYGTTTYDFLEVRRKSGVVTFLINGVEIHSETPAAVPTASGPFLLQAARQSSGTMTALVDVAKFRMRR